MDSTFEMSCFILSCFHLFVIFSACLVSYINTNIAYAFSGVFEMMHETEGGRYERTSFSTYNEPMAKELKKTSAGQEIVNVPSYEFLCKAAEKIRRKMRYFPKQEMRS